MFRETNTNTQMSLFDNPADLMGKRAVKKYEDPKAWFNRFYELVTSQIDESVFKPLFKAGNMGAPTASIRQIVAMNILKEGFGCSDEDLIEKCDYDLLTRRALGLIRLEDEAPSIDTYYLLRRRICDYADATGENLMETCFSRLTKFQAAKFKISGKSVRMDSKLIGSNIAWYSRYELVHKTFLQEIGQYMSSLNPSLRKKAQPWIEEDAKQTVYRSNSETILQRLAELGHLIYAVLVRVKAKRTRSGALRIPYPGERSKYKWRYFLPKQMESMRSRKLMEDIPQQENHKRNNVEASIFQLCFHTRNNKTRYRGKLKHELWAFARSAWINLRRIVLFQGKNAPEGTTGAHNGPLSTLMVLLNAMSQTCVHLKLYFSGTGFRLAMVAAGLKY